MSGREEHALGHDDRPIAEFPYRIAAQDTHNRRAKLRVRHHRNARPCAGSIPTGPLARCFSAEVCGPFIGMEAANQSLSLEWRIRTAFP